MNVEVFTNRLERIGRKRQIIVRLPDGDHRVIGTTLEGDEDAGFVILELDAVTLTPAVPSDAPDARPIAINPND